MDSVRHSCRQPERGITDPNKLSESAFHPGRSSATKRGKALRELLLCQDVPRPPPNVDFSAVENPDPNMHTARERVAAHLKNPVCAGCHRVTDPTVSRSRASTARGQYRDSENGASLDTTGQLGW